MALSMYTILCSRETDKLWEKTVGHLKQKYEQKWPGEVEKCVYDDDAIESCLPRLRETRPAYCCVVVQYWECTHYLVNRVHRLVRRIDDSNPFGDAMWGILTGSKEDDVLFSVDQEPLIVRRVFGGPPLDLRKVECGVSYSQEKPCMYYCKERGKSTVIEKQCPQDTTKILVDLLSEKRDVAADTGVDMVFIYGISSEVDWQLGYSYPNGHFCATSGDLCGVDLAGRVHPFQHNGRPKLLSAAGTCCTGLISKSSCMALAWMQSIGVVQMTGYLVPTWFGYMGLGVHDYFFNPGMYSFAESFFANNQALLAEIHRKYPEYQGLSSKYPEYHSSFLPRECKGLIYDRDDVVFYGDPAYDARLLAQPHLCLFSISVAESAIVGGSELEAGWKKFTLTVTINSEGKLNRPPVYLYPRCARHYKLLEGDAIVTCRFVLLPLSGPVKFSQKFTVSYALKQ